MLPTESTWRHRVHRCSSSETDGTPAQTTTTSTWHDYANQRRMHTAGLRSFLLTYTCTPLSSALSRQTPSHCWTNMSMADGMPSEVSSGSVGVVFELVQPSVPRRPGEITTRGQKVD